MDTPTKKVECPVCGSTDTVRQVEKRTIGDSLTGTMQIDRVVYTCNTCKENGDFADENDTIYDEAMKAFAKQSMATMLQKLSAQGIQLARFERSLGLPQRTTQRWKNDGGSAAATTLTKFVLSMPWLMDIADNRFEEKTLNVIVAQEGIKANMNLARMAETRPTPHFVLSGFQIDRRQAPFHLVPVLDEPRCVYHVEPSSYTGESAAMEAIA